MANLEKIEERKREREKNQLNKWYSLIWNAAIKCRKVKLHGNCRLKKMKKKKKNSLHTQLLFGCLVSISPFACRCRFRVCLVALRVFCHTTCVCGFVVGIIVVVGVVVGIAVVVAGCGALKKSLSTEQTKPSTPTMTTMANSKLKVSSLASYRAISAKLSEFLSELLLRWEVFNTVTRENAPLSHLIVCV